MSSPQASQPPTSNLSPALIDAIRRQVRHEVATFVKDVNDPLADDAKIIVRAEVVVDKNGIQWLLTEDADGHSQYTPDGIAALPLHQVIATPDGIAHLMRVVARDENINENIQSLIERSHRLAGELETANKEIEQLNAEVGNLQDKVDIRDRKLDALSESINALYAANYD